jgi:uncharacterized protein (TIGR03435 family)
MRLTLLFVFSAVAAQAQMAGPATRFEAISIRPAAPDPTGMTRVQGGIDSKDPGQVTYRNISVVNLLTRAYGPHASRQIVGPNWLDSVDVRFDVLAKIPPGTTKEQFAVMMQNLLAERFGLKLHHETKEFKAWNLVAAKSGAKLTPASPETGERPSGNAGQDAEGFPVLNHRGAKTIYSSRSDGGAVARMIAKDEPVSILLAQLSQELGGLVIDKTGLTGTYDFRIEYTPFVRQMLPGSAEAELGTPGLVSALRQIGLAVTETKAAQDVLVIDHVEKTPTGN